MVARSVSSLQHPLVKRLVRLRQSRSFRQQQQSVVIVGRKVIEEIALTTPLLKVLSSTPFPIAAEERYEAPSEVVQKVIGHPTDDLAVAEVSLPPPAPLQDSSLLIVLDQLQDPGNVGTVFRTALGLGWDGLLLLQGTADPYNDKALRASRGAPLKLPWKELSWEEIDTLAPKTRYQVVVADVTGTSLSAMKFSSPLLLVMGHETRGPSPAARARGIPVTIPLQGGLESLNVAAAASILLYEIKRSLHAHPRLS